MKIFLVLFAATLASSLASAESLNSLEKNKECIVSLLPSTGATLLPVEVRQQCARPLKFASDRARDGEAAEACEQGEEPADRDKDICKVSVSCRGSDEVTYRFSIDAKVKIHTGIGGIMASVSGGLLPKCQISGVSVIELQSQ